MTAEGVHCGQIAEVVVLWGVFLLTQQLKSGYPNCTWQYFTIFGVQVLFLLAVTAYSVRCAPPAIVATAITAARSSWLTCMMLCTCLCS